ATNTASFTVARANATGRLVVESAVDVVKITGSSTNTNTVKMSSIASQPIAILPVELWSSSLSASTRVSTTVLATESARPNTSPADQFHPRNTTMPAPSSVATVL